MDAYWLFCLIVLLLPKNILVPQKGTRRDGRFLRSKEGRPLSSPSSVAKITNSAPLTGSDFGFRILTRPQI